MVSTWKGAEQGEGRGRKVLEATALFQMRDHSSQAQMSARARDGQTSDST